MSNTNHALHAWPQQWLQWLVLIFCAKKLHVFHLISYSKILKTLLQHNTYFLGVFGQFLKTFLMIFTEHKWFTVLLLQVSAHITKINSLGKGIIHLLLHILLLALHNIHEVRCPGHGDPVTGLLSHAEAASVWTWWSRTMAYWLDFPQCSSQRGHMAHRNHHSWQDCMSTMCTKPASHTWTCSLCQNSSLDGNG